MSEQTFTVAQQLLSEALTAQAAELSSLRELVKEMREALDAALEWIDAVPDSIVLPAMPGFDRDSVSETLAKADAVLKESGQ